jgi:hypothetical protein
MRFGTWNVRSLCRVGAIKSVGGGGGELEKYKLDLVGVQDVRWDIKYQTTIHFSMEKGMLITA